MEIIDVFAVYGDFGNCDFKGTLIGIFDNAAQAEKISKGRGSLDCGGNAIIVDKKAIRDGDDIYLMELNFPTSINKELTPNPRYISEEYSIIVTDVKEKIEFMRLIRRMTGMSLLETKGVMDTFYSKGEAVIPPNRESLNGKFSKEDAIRWKQEAELRGIARLEFK